MTRISMTLQSNNYRIIWFSFLMKTFFSLFFSAPDSILEVDSLEADLILDEQSLEDSIQAIPEPIWPEKNNTSQALQIPNPNTVKVDKDLNYVADISFFNGKKDGNSNDVLGTIHVLCEQF